MAAVLGPKDFVVYPEVLTQDGAFGRIELIEKISDPGRTLLWKKQSLNESSKRRLKAELMALKFLVGVAPFVQLINSFADENNVYFVMKFHIRGTLRHKIAKGIQQNEARKNIAQLATGLNLLHTNKLIHRDFKPGNILVDEGDNLKIADFGTVFYMAAQPTAVVGTIEYMSDEIAEVFLKRRSHYDEKCDYRALGVVCYEIFTRTRPLSFGKNRQINETNMLKIVEFPAIVQSNVLKGNAFELTSKLMSKDPEQRWTINEIRSCKFFQDVKYPFDSVFEGVLPVGRRMKTSDSWIFNQETSLPIAASSKRPRQ